MGSLGGEFAEKAMWLYPKILGFNPSERWGHSACHSHGLVYVFGGCCGGIHFSDVLVLNLETMSWSVLATEGKGPGPRDSHSAVLWGEKMVVFGGTDGSRKVNDLHILDLRSNEWTRPVCMGNPPHPRESHAATIVGDHKLVVFGGSGEGVQNYLNDLHVLDLNTMAWSSPAVKGDVPSPRDSHTLFAARNELFLFGGDSGDQYHGEVDRFDMNTFTWKKLAIEGPSPGARAGHAAVSIRSKIYVIGGVGDKIYYNDAWSLDTDTCSWSKLNVHGQAPQGRFSHTAIIAGSEIVIYGGCGEDERPLRELLMLQLRNQHPSERCNISVCKSSDNHRIQEKKIPRLVEEHRLKTMLLGVGVKADQALHSKRRRAIDNAKTWEIQSQPEEHSLSVSQHSSPSHSDQEQTTVGKQPKSLPRHALAFLHQANQSPRDRQSSNIIATTNDHSSLISNQKSDPFPHTRHQISLPATEERSIQDRPHQSLIGSEVQGKVDGAFDSGYLMTAFVNGRVFRGVLFAAVPSIVYRSGGALHQNPSPMISNTQTVMSRPNAAGSEMGIGLGSYRPNLHPFTSTAFDSSGQGINRARVAQPSSFARDTPSSRRELMRHRSDLEGVVLSLGGPSSGHE